jgi:hypothetical protein
MIRINLRIAYSVSLFVLIMILVNIVKPNIVYKNDATVRSFGIHKNETIFSLGVFSVVSSILSFYLFCLIDMIFN